MQYILSLQDSENLKKSLCASNKAKKQYEMPVIFKPSDDNALKTGKLNLYHAMRKPFMNIIQKCQCHIWAKTPRQCLVQNPASLIVCSAYGMGSLHIWKSMLKVISRFKSRICSQDNVFSRESLAYVSRTGLNRILHPGQQHGFTGEESVC